MSACPQVHAQGRWVAVDPRTRACLPVSQSGCYKSLSPQVFQPSSPNWRTRWYVANRPRICFASRGPTSYICKPRIQPSRTEIFSDWERTSCSGLRARTQSPLHIWKTSDFVNWPQTSGIDAFKFDGKDYFCVVDYYWSYFEVDRLETKTAKGIATCKILRKQFSVHGIPNQLISDDMIFSSLEFREFAARYGFEVITRSPAYSKSYGRILLKFTTIDPNNVQKM